MLTIIDILINIVKIYISIVDVVAVGGGLVWW